MPVPDPEFGVLLLLGLGIFGGILGAWLFQRLGIPQVIGYLCIGLLLGDTGFGLISPDAVFGLRPFTYLALAIIGFLVGGELEAGLFRKYGRQFVAIMLGEGLGAFLLVGLASGGLLLVLTGNPVVSLAGALVFGAIASATDPASTLDVLWEYRSRGVLTTSLGAVVALDDALAMALYAFGTTAASMLAGSEVSLMSVLRSLGVELLGSIGLGLAMGLLLHALLRRKQRPERTLALLVGLLMLLGGICLRAGLDVILASMSMGLALINLAPQRHPGVFKSLRSFASPVYVMFFVLVGASLRLGQMPGWIWALVALYVFFRSLGKFSGAWIGARMSQSEKVVRDNLGLGLFAQGGVAIGLSIMAGQHLSGVVVLGNLDLGQVVTATVTATTLLVQLIGPPCVKFAITRADEIGRNVTEEDIIGELKVGDVLEADLVVLRETDTLGRVFDVVSQGDQVAFPVADAAGACTGIISLESLKLLFTQQEIWTWMIAEDVMAPARDLMRAETPLADALEAMRELAVDQAIVRDPASRRPLGIFDTRSARRAVTRRLMQRQGI